MSAQNVRKLVLMDVAKSFTFLKSMDIRKTSVLMRMLNATFAKRLMFLDISWLTTKMSLVSPYKSAKDAIIIISRVMVLISLRNASKSSLNK
jgi:hypothetical protein